MTAVLIAEALAILLLGLLVVGLLRSHAEILRRLDRLGVRLDDREPAASPSPAEFLSAEADAHDLSGVTPGDEAIAVAVASAPHRTLLAFLSGSCQSCEPFWESFAAPDQRLGDLRPVIVTLGPEEESPTRVGRVAPAAVPVVMSSKAWADYGVPSAPYFVLVDGARRRVLGEGSAASWERLRSLLDDALGDAAWDARRARRRSDRDRADLIDAELMAAGIQPGHPSLYGKVEGGSEEGI